jgi:serine/threonine-protein kinase
MTPQILPLGSLPETAPARVGKYQVHAEIGRGSCGVVYKGHDPFVKRDVAIKAALRAPDASATPGDEHELAFFTEARAAGMLQHPHIVSTYDAGVEQNLNYIVMEFIDGDTLQPLCMPRETPVTIEQVLDIGYKCAKALDYAHAKGVLHRDIKPSNIMLTRDGVPKLMDFSIAQINTGQAPETTSVVMGSPLYMSPEQVRKIELGPTSDLYALGAVLFQMLTGRPPFTAEGGLPSLFHQIRNIPAPRADTLRKDIPKPLTEIVERLLLKDPAQRYASGHELAVALGRLHDQIAASARQGGRRDAHNWLTRLHFFNGFTDEEIGEILDASSMNTYAAGQTLIEEGTLENALYIIAVGRAEVRKAGKRLHTLEKGDCVGEIGFLSAARRSASVVAETQVMALKVNATLMEKVSRECQLRFYKVFAETLIYRLSLTSARLSSLTA